MSNMSVIEAFTSEENLENLYRSDTKEPAKHDYEECAACGDVMGYTYQVCGKDSVSKEIKEYTLCSVCVYEAGVK